MCPFSKIAKSWNHSTLILTRTSKNTFNRHSIEGTCEYMNQDLHFPEIRFFLTENICQEIFQITIFFMNRKTTTRTQRFKITLRCVQDTAGIIFLRLVIPIYFCLRSILIPNDVGYVQPTILYRTKDMLYAKIK